MKPLLLFLMLSQTILSVGQGWPTPSSEWHYKFFSDQTAHLYFSHYDTLGGFPVSVIRNEYTYTSFGGNQVTIDLEHGAFRASGDSVLYWDEDQFFLLYHFGAQVGDSWVAGVEQGFMCPDTAIVLEVTETGVLSVNGVGNRFIRITTTSDTHKGLDDVILEGVGPVSLTTWPDHPAGRGLLFGERLMSQCQVPETAPNSFKCYYDSMIGIYNPDNTFCGLTGVKEEESLVPLRLWPNPVQAGASTSLSVRLPEGVRASDIEGVEMRDEMGRQVIDSKFKIQDEGIGTLSIGSLPSGIYFLQLVTYEQVYSAKVVKE